MRFIVLSLFPGMVKSFSEESILGRAQKEGKISIEYFNLSDWGIGKWKKVDDTPYGGGAGMVFRADVVIPAINDLKNKYKDAKVILTTPQGEKYSQGLAQKLADSKNDLIIVCGHYEGFDERIRDYADMEISIGDYVLTGGELAAGVIIDSVARLLPDVLGKEVSHQDDSFSIQQQATSDKRQALLEYPHYTRPEIFNGKKVPEILQSGNHKKIEEWRCEQSIRRTKIKRPDLINE